MSGIIEKIKILCYDKIQDHPVGTPVLYRKMLSFINNDSYILEIGIGDGLCHEKNSQIIINKNLYILGIDIDQDYLSYCKYRIGKINLSNRVACIDKRLSDFESQHCFDYVIFPGSFPVIPLEEIELSLNKLILMLSPNGKIIFIHGLWGNENSTMLNIIIFKILNVIKTHIKYVPFLWTDFGRITSISEFESFLNKNSLFIDDKIKIEEAKSRYRIISFFSKIINNIFNNDNYIYIVSPFNSYSRE